MEFATFLSAVKGKKRTDQYKQARETCQHYDAYDSGNFASHLKDFAADISGSKESGYILTPRGLTDATELLKKMIEQSKLTKGL